MKNQTLLLLAAAVGGALYLHNKKKKAATAAVAQAIAKAPELQTAQETTTARPALAPGPVAEASEAAMGYVAVGRW